MLPRSLSTALLLFFFARFLIPTMSFHQSGQDAVALGASVDLFLLLARLAGHHADLQVRGRPFACRRVWAGLIDERSALERVTDCPLMNRSRSYVE